MGVFSHHIFNINIKSHCWLLLINFALFLVLVISQFTSLIFYFSWQDYISLSLTNGCHKGIVTFLHDGGCGKKIIIFYYVCYLSLSKRSYLYGTFEYQSSDLAFNFTHCWVLCEYLLVFEYITLHLWIVIC